MTERVKGFAAWKPQAKTTARLAPVLDVLEEQRDYWPITNRQLFYACVGRELIAKTEDGYDQLCEWMNRGRRSGLVPWSAIRDDGETEILPLTSGWRSWTPEMEETRLRQRRLTWSRDRMFGQPVYVEVWTEAAGMAAQVARHLEGYHVPVYSAGGFGSVTAKHQAHRRYVGDGRPVIVLHVGDHDPSGLSIMESARKDIVQFCLDAGQPDAVPTFIRPAVTPEQIVELGLPTAPPKKTDKRGEFQGETVQCEAIPPGTLLEIIEDALRSVIDLDILDNIAASEADDHRRIDEWVDGLFGEAS